MSSSLSDTASPGQEELLAELRAAMKAEFGLDPASVRPAAHLVDDLELDSIDLVDLAVTLEERAGIRLEEEALKAVRTVQDAVEAIGAALARRNAGSA